MNPGDSLEDGLKQVVLCQPTDFSVHQSVEVISINNDVTRTLLGMGYSSLPPLKLKTMLPTGVSICMHRITDFWNLHI